MIQTPSLDYETFNWQDSFPGVYCIKCLISKKCYIGSSIDIRNRLNGSAGHLYHLNRKTHPNKELQADFIKYGIENFTVGVVSIAENLAQARSQEQDILNIMFKHAPKSIYNIATKVEYYDGKDRKITGKLISPEGKIIEFNGIKEFCRKYGLDRAAISRVQHNPRLTYKGWKNVNYQQEIESPIRLQDPNGQIHTVEWRNLNLFCQQHDLKRRGILNLIAGRQLAHKGWIYLDQIIDKTRLKTIEWLDMNGLQHSIERAQLEEYCKQYGYHPKSFMETANGIRKHYKDIWAHNTPLSEIETYKKTHPPKIPKVIPVIHLLSPGGASIDIPYNKRLNFATQNGLKFGQLSRLCRGERPRYKGWSLREPFVRHLELE